VGKYGLKNNLKQKYLPQNNSGFGPKTINFGLKSKENKG
jgi:hypothetical protein